MGLASKRVVIVEPVHTLRTSTNSRLRNNSSNASTSSLPCLTYCSISAITCWMCETQDTTAGGSGDLVERGSAPSNGCLSVYVCKPKEHDNTCAAILRTCQARVFFLIHVLIQQNHLPKLARTHTLPSRSASPKPGPRRAIAVEYVGACPDRTRNVFRNNQEWKGNKHFA